MQSVSFISIYVVSWNYFLSCSQLVLCPILQSVGITLFFLSFSQILFLQSVGIISFPEVSWYYIVFPFLQSNTFPVVSQYYFLSCSPLELFSFLQFVVFPFLQSQLRFFSMNSFICLTPIGAILVWNLHFNIIFFNFVLINH